jgi:ABC-type transporter Mla subunit MlaD
MKGISQTQYNQLLDKATYLQRIFSHSQHPHAYKLEQMSDELQQLYAEHQALLETLAKNIDSYNAQHSNLRKACRTATSVSDKLPRKDKAA